MVIPPNNNTFNSPMTKQCGISKEVNQSVSCWTIPTSISFHAGNELKALWGMTNIGVRIISPVFMNLLHCFMYISSVLNENLKILTHNFCVFREWYITLPIWILATVI